jgi:hypothetical protein
VNWSIQARHSLSQAESLIGVLRAQPTDWQFNEYRLDLSEQSGELWNATRTWLASEGENVDTLTWGGYGSLLWLRNGKVVDRAFSAGEASKGDLLARTESAFMEP